MLLGLSNFTSDPLAWPKWLGWLTSPRDPAIYVLLAAVLLLTGLGRLNSGLAPRK